jgi:membrane-bound serine protease (ClpP class)
VLQVDVDHVIHPLTVELVAGAISQAERERAAAVLIRLNTPGGLLTATQGVIQRIIASPVPVITYVAPSGGRAASAGFMILMAGDVAAMAPGTNTGAAHPVVLGGGEMDPVMKQKVENDAAAAVRSVAAKRGRNAELAQKAVIESQAFTEEEALKQNLIDLVANDVPGLLNSLDGKTIRRFNGGEETIHLAGATVYPFELSTRQRILLSLIDPNLAFMFLVLGLIGIYVEFTNPGLIVPGVAGAILAILGLMALSVLPINWAGAALIAVGLACFVLEAMVVSHGVLGTGGAIAMVMGAVMLVDTGVPELTISWSTAIGVTLPFALITVFLLQLAIRSYHYKVATGSEALVGETGVAKTDIHRTGRVFIHGEWWNARSDRPIPPGSTVQVVRIDGLTLTVTPAESDESAPLANSGALADADQRHR